MAGLNVPECIILDKTMNEKDIDEAMVHTNKITNSYIEYLDNMNTNDISGLSFQKSTGFNIINYNEKEGYKLIDTTNFGIQSPYGKQICTW